MNDKDREQLENLIYVESITKITGYLLTYGSDRVWKSIEAISNPRARLKYREFFFNAGGEVPQTKIIF